jgi:hypothetical protein
MTRACATCAWWDRADPDSVYGSCRRNAPRPMMYGDGSINWPVTEESDWCGEYGPRASV